jgi:hypothetical protein
MAPESDSFPSSVSPRHIWAFIPPHSQQQIVQLLARLAMHLIAAEPPCQRMDLNAKEHVHAHSSSSHQDPA